MSRNLMVAVWGSKAVGVTTFCAALANSLSEYFYSILLINANRFQPAFAIWGVTENPVKDGKAHLSMDSIGHLLLCPDLTEELIRRNVVVHPDNNNIGLMGYLTSDDCELYESINGNAAQSLLNITRKFAQLTIVDCTLPQTDRITEKALQSADIVITMAEPNPAGVAFFRAQHSFISRNLLDKRKYLCIASKVEPESAIAQFEYQLGIKLYRHKLPYTHDAVEKLNRLELFKRYSGEYQETVDAVASRVKEEAESD